MTISLMAYVPNDSVFRGIINVMKGHSNLYHAKARCQMAGVYGYLLYDILTEFLANFGQIVYLQFAQILRILNLI
jgi:hypothetical protein